MKTNFFKFYEVDGFFCAKGTSKEVELEKWNECYLTCNFFSNLFLIRNFSRNPCLMRGKRVRYICNIPCQIFEKSSVKTWVLGQSLGLTAIMLETVDRCDRMSFTSGSIFGLRHWWNNNYRHNTDQIKRSTLGFISRLLYHYSNCAGLSSMYCFLQKTTWFKIKESVHMTETSLHIPNNRFMKWKCRDMSIL